MPLPTKRCIKVISSLFGFAAVERQTIKRKTLKIWVKFGVAAPGPWGEGRNFTPRRHWRHLSCKQSRKQELAAVLSFCGTMSPVDAGNAVTPSTGPAMSQLLARPTTGKIIIAPVSDGFYDTERPKTPNRK